MNILHVKDPKLGKILRNPIRYSIIFAIGDERGPTTVKQIADRLDMKHGNVFYHVKKLYDVGVLKVVKTELINGIAMKYYEIAYDDIYYNEGSLDEVSPSDIAGCSRLVFKRATDNFIESVHPSNISYEITDAIYDVVQKREYYFNPDDIAKISKEIIQIYEKYEVTPDEGVKYSILKGIGKYRYR